MNDKKVPVLVIQFLDLDLSIEKKTELQGELEKAANGEITLIPIAMEGINPIYYRDKVLQSQAGYSSPTGTFMGRMYTGLTDDQRAIRSFIDGTFNWLSNVLPGREKIIVRYTEFYKAEAQRMYNLIKGQELKSELIFTNEFE